MATMKAAKFAEKLHNIATNYKTVYIKGGFGAVITKPTLDLYAKIYPSWYTSSKMKSLLALAGSGTFGFDCSGVIKAVLWGWSGDASKTYGGAGYASNDIPDINDQGMIDVCTNVSDDFSKIEVGELLWRQGHVGVYIGDGLAVECTNQTGLRDGVQITAVLNIEDKDDYNGRRWKKHGKLPWIDYEVEKKSEKNIVNIELDLLQRGAKGEQVKTLQRLLLALGYSLANYGVDGSFGGTTEKAVKAFQKDRKINQSGKVDAETWSKLLCGN